MENFIKKYNFYIFITLGVCVAIYLGVNWQFISKIQKLIGFYAIAILMHCTEELYLPGGFIDMVTKNLGLKLKNLGFAKFMLLIVLIIVNFTPLFFPNVIWICLAPFMIGFIEIVGHTLAIKMCDYKFYSPGLVTAAFLLFPLSVYGFYCFINAGLIKWTFYMLFYICLSLYLLHKGLLLNLMV